MDNSLFNFKASNLILSTNPKLTTNVKIMVDSKDNIFLESFDANNELSQFKFKKYRVSSNSLYNKDLYNFYSRGKFPKQFAYQIFKSDTDLKILKDFSKQYDNFYKYGTQRLVSKLYDEEASILAPLWLNDYVPKYFIIFKANGPNYSDFKEDVLYNSEIIKTIDLTENSNIGKYIRNYQANLPFAPISFSPEKEDMTYFNGIDYNTGTINSKGNYIHSDYINNDKTIIEYDYYITKKFEENGIVLANLLNLEFLFNDDTSEDYEINRYFGLYVDDIEDGLFELDIDTLYKKKQINKHQIIQPELITGNRKSFYIKGLNGTTIYGKNAVSDIGLYDYDDIKELNTFFYIKDVNESFHLIKTKDRWKKDEVKLSDTYLDLKSFISTTTSSSFLDLDITASSSKSHVIFEIKNHVPNSFGIKFYDEDDLFLEIYADESLTIFNQNDSDFYFVAKDKLKNIAKSIAKAINNMGRNKIAAYSKDNYVVVYSIFFGSNFNSLNFEFKNRHISSDLIFNSYSNDSYFMGGSNPLDFRYIVNANLIDVFNNKYVVLANGAVEKAATGFYIDDKDRLLTHRTIILKEKPKFSNGQVILINKYQISFGRFNIYPVKDFDFDFYTEEYEQNKEIVLEKDYYENETATPNDVLQFYEENNLYELTNNETNEYDINKENYNIDFAKISKVVPYINKWSYKNGKDIRGYDYRLNSAKAFGIYNRTPSQIIKDQNIDAYTHEWLYIKTIPHFYNNDENQISSYIEKTFTEEDFYNISEDHFLKVFSFNEINLKVLNNNEFKFAIFEGGNASNFTTAFFKGIKVHIKEKEDSQTINYNINSLKLKSNYTKFNEYKFSTILVNDEDFIESDYGIKIIKNEKFKFIVLQVTANINFTSSLDKTLLYSLKHRYKNIPENEDDIYEDVLLRGYIDLENTIFTGEHYIIKGAIDNENVATEFIKQIKIDKNGKFFQIHFNYEGVDYKIYDVFRVLANNTLLARKFVRDDGVSGEQDLFTFPMIYPSKRDMGYLNYDNTISDYGIIVKNGGFNFYQDLIKNISFANIYNDINEGNPIVEYISINENGEKERDGFILSLNAPNLIAKPMYIEKIPDPDKPINFNFVNIIGYRLKLKSNIEVAPFYKHKGYFTPKLKTIFNFIDPYSGDYEIDEAFKEKMLRQVKYLNTNISSISNIKNRFYHKVTNKDYNILELENNNDFKSLYPLINECSFDYNDYDVFETNWGDNYYLNYVEKNVKESIVIKGLKDRKNFFGSKYMKTPLKVVFEKDIYYEIDNNTNTEVAIRFNIKEILIEYLSKRIDGFPSNDIEKDYITNNVSVLYESSKIDLYKKEFINGGNIDFSGMDMDNAEKQTYGLTITKDYELIKTNNLDFSIKYRKVKGLSYVFGISIDVELI